MKDRIAYDAYIASESWAAKRRAFRRSRRKSSCWICGAKKVHFHHRTYERFGNEDLDDLVPLCQEHHALLHQFQHVMKLSVEEATTRYLAESKARPPKVKRKRKTGALDINQAQMDDLARSMMNGGVDRQVRPSRKGQPTPKKPVQTKAQKRKEGLGLVEIPQGRTQAPDYWTHRHPRP